MSLYSDLGRHLGSGERVLDAVKRNPEGLLLLAAGCALLLRSRSSSQSSGMQHSGMQHRGMQHGSYPSSGEWQRTYADSAAGERSSMESMRNGASRRAEQGWESASSTMDQASQTVRSYASSASEYASQMQRQASDYAGHASEYARRMAGDAQTSLRETVDYVLREQPLAVAMAGLAAGAGLAAVFPSTRFEKDTFGEVGSRVTGAIQEKGEQLKETATRAGEKLREAAQDPSKIKENLSGIADDVQRSVSSFTQGEGDKSKSQAQPGSSTSPSPGADSQSRSPTGNGTASGSTGYQPPGGSPPKYVGDRR